MSLMLGGGRSALSGIGTAAVIYVPGAFRIARSLAVNINALDYVTVARTRGEGTPYIMLREILAGGKISSIFGALFEQQDGFHRQVRMPEPPMLLADRITGIDAVAVGVPTNLDRSMRYMRNEALKTTLAFFESLFRRGTSSQAAQPRPGAAVATR